MIPESIYLTTHHGQKGNEGKSPRIWDRYKLTLQAPDVGRSPYISLEDFGNFAPVAPAPAGATDGVSGGFAAFVSTTTTASSVKQLAELNGVVELATGATNHHQAALQGGGGTGGTIAVGATNIAGFEARVKIPDGNSVTAQGAFVGVAKPGSAITNFMANTTMALSDTDVIGFHFLPDGTIHATYRKTGKTAVDLGAVASAQAGAWVKLGFLFETRADAADRLQFFVNNQRVAAASFEAIEADDFPKAAVLAPIVSLKTIGSNAAKLQCDWIGGFTG